MSGNDEFTSGRPRPGRPTLEDVAALAGVGRSTVSRVVTGSSSVSGPARQAVEEAVAKLGYVPNAAARTLVTRRTDAIAFIVSDAEIRQAPEAFFGGVLRGIGLETEARGRQLVLALSQDEQRLGRYLARQVVDGVMLMSFEAGDPRPWHIRHSGVPMVLAGRPSGWTDDCCVTVDNHAGAVEATTYLVGAGCRRIAMITGPAEIIDARERYDGYVEALRAAGREVDPALVTKGEFNVELSGDRAVRLLLDRDPTIDGLFVANDRMAFGALRALRASGRRVPDDVRVIGFDDDPIALVSDPPLTTMAQPVEELGRRMVTMLLDQIDTGRTDVTPVVLPTTLLRRASA